MSDVVLVGVVVRDGPERGSLVEGGSLGIWEFNGFASFAQHIWKCSRCSRQVAGLSSICPEWKDPNLGVEEEEVPASYSTLVAQMNCLKCP